MKDDKMIKRPPQEKQWQSWLYVVLWTLVIFVTIPLARAIQQYVYQEWNRDILVSRENPCRQTITLKGGAD